MDTTLIAAPAARRFPLRSTAVLSVVALIGLLFVVREALPYFKLTEVQFGRYWPHRSWLLVHITAGIVALLAGPVQLWLGLTDRSVKAHRRLGLVYIGSVVSGSVAGYYLAFNTTFGWVFGTGLACLATAWIVTTGLAFAAIRRHLYEQHKEWMIRSYVVTTAFVTFRLFFELLRWTAIGTIVERLTAMAWLCWAIPLLVTEAVLQGRKILASRD
jgi:predicted membrane protein DUF2306